MRLVNGSVINEGLVEICFNGRWGGICHNGWDVVDTNVLCNQLGFPGNSECFVANVSSLIVGAGGLECSHSVSPSLSPPFL